MAKLIRASCISDNPALVAGFVFLQQRDVRLSGRDSSCEAESAGKLKCINKRIS